MKRRLGRVGLAVGAAAMVVATGVASAGDGGPAPSPGVLMTPGIEAEGARGAAVQYLVGQGMSEEQARQRMVNQSAALQAATELRQRAPSGVGSVWLDDDGSLQVRVLDEVGAAAAEAVGATAVFGTLATADLEAVRDALADDAVKDPPAGLSGAVFEVDEAADKVVARYLFAEPGGVVPQAATDLGDLVTASVEVASVRPQADVFVAGARTYKDNNGLRSNWCTAAWAVDIQVAGGGVPKNGVMTAGHCFEQDKDPEQTKFMIDTEAAGDTPATGVLFVYDTRGDYGVLELGDGHRGRTRMSDGLHVVEAVEEPVVGTVVCKHGAWTGPTCGEILKTDISVLNQPDGSPGTLLKGMVRADLCAAPGDSGAPVFAEFDEAKSVFGVAAIGILSTGLLYFQPEGNPVCGAKGDLRNEAAFMPLSGIDTEGKFRIRIDGG